ncbi:MAG: SDR family NAD(P)-dependent oxidoreductase [Verrucomicrobia bacterium]|nr:SDR family NAD(P)-dependent oxidoreductase [Verrucomicrobiota bacterium]
MKALVTGGAGFIGSHIAQTLCGNGAKVIVLDKLQSDAPPNLAWRKNSDDLDWVQGDITDADLVKKLISGCDWVFHHAAIASVPHSVEQPIDSNRNNLDGSLELLVAARDANVKRFVFASSSAIYGDDETPAKHERLSPAPLSPYALQKYASEKYGQMFHQLFGLETVSLRYFNVFGPRQAFDSPYSGVIAKFCTAMLQNQRPRIFGDGLQSRDFVFVENVVAANLLAASAASGKVAGKFFNVGGGNSITLLQLVAELNRLTGQNLAPQFEPPRMGDVRASQADITEAKTGFGFDPKVSWQAGLEQTLNFYRA